MILPFKTKFDNGEPTCFVEKILDACFRGLIAVDKDILNIKYAECKDRGLFDTLSPAHLDTKLHTIRIDKHNRWRAGVDIHARVNNRTKDTYQFAPTFTCVSTQEISIKCVKAKNDHYYMKIFIDGRELDFTESLHLSENDGFDTFDEFKYYFRKGFEGKIIHFTSLRY